MAGIPLDPSLWTSDYSPIIEYHGALVKVGSLGVGEIGEIALHENGFSVEHAMAGISDNTDEVLQINCRGGEIGIARSGQIVDFYNALWPGPYATLFSVVQVITR